MGGQYEKHVFVCIAGKTCPRQGSLEVLDLLRRRIKEAGLNQRIRINKSGCMAQCGHGPMLVVYPENVWYGAVTVADAELILKQHLMGGIPVERLLYTPDGPGIQICAKGEERIPPTPLEELENESGEKRKETTAPGS